MKTIRNTSFSPFMNGFHFPNDFVNHVLTIPFLGGITTRGRCGGMAYSSLDYFFAGLPVPTHRAGDFGPGRDVPPDGSALASICWNRLLDSIFDNIGHWFDFIVNPFTDHIQLTKAAIAKAMQSIEQGRPVPLGLLVSGNLSDAGSDHQVVAYGYELDEDTQTLTLFIYDNDVPDTRVLMTMNPVNPAHITYAVDPLFAGRTPYTVTRSSWWAFFVADGYRQQVPKYRDLVCDGMDVKQTGPIQKTWQGPNDAPGNKPITFHEVDYQLQISGKPLDASFTVKNVGQFNAHYIYLALAIDGPSGRTAVYAGEQPTATPLAPGQSASALIQQERFGEAPGSHSLSPAFSPYSDGMKDPPLALFDAGHVWVNVVAAGYEPPPLGPQPAPIEPPQPEKGWAANA